MTTQQATCGHDRPGNCSALAKCGCSPEKLCLRHLAARANPCSGPFGLAWRAGTEQGRLRKPASGESADCISALARDRTSRGFPNTAPGNGHDRSGRDFWLDDRAGYRRPLRSHRRSWPRRHERRLRGTPPHVGPAPRCQDSAAVACWGREVWARYMREAQIWVDLGLHPNVVPCWYVRMIDEAASRVPRMRRRRNCSELARYAKTPVRRVGIHSRYGDLGL